MIFSIYNNIHPQHTPYTPHIHIIYMRAVRRDVCILEHREHNIRGPYYLRAAAIICSHCGECENCLCVAVWNDPSTYIMLDIHQLTDIERFRTQHIINIANDVINSTGIPKPIRLLEVLMPDGLLYNAKRGPNPIYAVNAPVYAPMSIHLPY